jgi:flagellar basal-body rod protein FlgB
MELFDTTQIALGRAIVGAGQRQELLSANLANANTPGYIRRDLDFHSSLRAALNDEETSPESVQFAPVAGNGPGRVDGNGVDLDVEAAELAKNGLEYQALVAVARGRIDIIQSAMGPAR